MTTQKRPAGNGASPEDQAGSRSIVSLPLTEVDALDALAKAVDGTFVVTHEPSAWVRSAAADRVRDVKRRGLDPSCADPMIVAPLGRVGAPGSREDRACDRCRRYTPEGELFYPFAVQPLPGLLLVGGLCAVCHRKEVAR